MKTTIWTLTVDHRHGIDTTVHGTETAAYAHLKAQFLGDELWDTEGHSIKVTDDMEASDLLQWLGSGANEVSVNGPEPVVIDVPDVKIEIIHSRDPDGECGFSYYINGERDTYSAQDITQFDLDAGRGYEFADWAGQAASAKAVASSGVWAELEQYYADPCGDRYIDGLPDTAEWVTHLDETPENKVWWRTNHPGVPMSYVFTPIWTPINDHPGDQRYDDIPSDADGSYWGEIGPEGDGTWSWTIVRRNDDGTTEDVHGGFVNHEHAAKSMIENWTIRPA